MTKFTPGVMSKDKGDVPVLPKRGDYIRVITLYVKGEYDTLDGKSVRLLVDDGQGRSEYLPVEWCERMEEGDQ